MSLVTFQKVYEAWPWKPIPGCPGRYVLSPAAFAGPPSELCGFALAEEVIPPSGSADPAVVVRFEDGGLISYRKPDDSFVHTLNTPEGLARKLAEMASKRFPLE